MPTLVTTPGSASANAYVTEAEVTTVADALHPNATAWGDASLNEQRRAILTATRLLDQERYVGGRVDAVQALEFPRSGAPKRPPGTLYLTTEIPEPVKRACARLAIWLVQQGDTEDPFAPDELAAFREIRFGSELTISGAGASIPAGARFLAQVIRPILADLLLPAQVRVIRG